jgi:hypothetical protein
MRSPVPQGTAKQQQLRHIPDHRQNGSGDRARSEQRRNAMNIDKQQNDNQVQQNDNRALNDDELCLVQGGGNLIDFAKFLFNTVNDVLRIANGRPQV